MECKIGEIFEHNGEWYQCTIATFGCSGCSFKPERPCNLMPECSSVRRSDSNSVIFKKLEKVGDKFPYEGKQMQSYIRATDASICNWNNSLLLLEHGDSDIVDIEIKQNKEDMEEYKMYDAKEDIPEFDKVVDECLFGKDKLKPFDIQKAREGKPVCTRDGRKVRIICFDFKRPNPIIALVENGNAEDILVYPLSGEYHNRVLPENDLFMLPEKKEGWVNVYNADTTFYYVEGMVYNTKDEAIQKAKKEITTEQREKSEYVDTVKINWEE